MRGILADINCQGQADFLLRLLQTSYRLEFWVDLAIEVCAFSEVDLHPKSPDDEIWRTCQNKELVLITANRSADSPDSLEQTIRQENQPDSLPVVTISDSDRVVYDREFADRAADRLLEILFEIDDYRGTGRLYIP